MSHAKLKIKGSTSDPSGSGGSGGGKEFEAKVNPDSIKRYKSVRYNDDNTSSGATDARQFQGYDPDYMSFTLILEALGLSSNPDGFTSQQYDSSVSIDAQYSKLREVCYDYDGSIHKTLYNTIIFGSDITFKGHCTKMEIDYCNFKDDLTCLMAEVTLEFREHINRDASAKAQNANSPDLSHIKVIRAGDKLTNICHDIYKDPLYYLHIAKLNGLTNFRNVNPGQKIIFPPLKD